MPRFAPLAVLLLLAGSLPALPVQGRVVLDVDEPLPGLVRALPLPGARAGSDVCLGAIGPVERLGDACPAPWGWRVFLASGGHLDTHGHDPEPPEEVFASGAQGNGTGAMPEEPYAACTTDLTQYRVELVYAYPPDKYDHAGPRKVRETFFGANAWFAGEAAQANQFLNVRVLCDDDGNPVVHEVETLESTFGGIGDDVIAAGHDEPRVKYWMIYPFGLGGIADRKQDSRPGPENLNNNAQGAMYALTFSYNSYVMAHEGGHTMGAVQNDAPHASGAGHCTDGRDMMCYDDDGPYSAAYTNSFCEVAQVDCGNDDYFGFDPAPWSYLASHWNLASPWNLVMDRCGQDGQATRDVALCSASMPRWAKPGSSVRVDALLRNAGLGRANATLTVSIPGVAQTDVAVPDLRPGEVRKVNATLAIPASQGWHNGTLEVFARERDLDERPENGERSGDFTVAIPRREYKVAFPADALPLDPRGWKEIGDAWWKYGADAPTFVAAGTSLAKVRASGAEVILYADSGERLQTRDLLELMRDGRALLWSGYVPPGFETFVGMGTADRVLCPTALSRVVLFQPGAEAFSRNLPFPYVPGPKCGQREGEGGAAVRMADSPPEGLHRLSAYEPADSTLGAGIAVHTTWDTTSLTQGATPADLQLASNSLSWLVDHARRAPVDLSVMELNSTHVFACRGYRFEAEGRVRNHGALDSGPFTIRFTRDGGWPVETRSFASLPPGGETRFNVSVMPSPYEVYLDLRATVESPLDAYHANDATDAAPWYLETCSPPGPIPGFTLQAGPAASEVTFTVESPEWNGGQGDRRGHWRLERAGGGATVTRNHPVCGLSTCVFTDGGLAPDTTYTYRLWAVNGAGASPAAGPASVTTYPAIPPAAPTLAARQGPVNGTLFLSWTTPPGAAVPTRFELEISNGTVNVTEPMLGLQNVTKFLPPGPYAFRLRGMNDLGWSAWSAPLAADAVWLEGQSAAAHLHGKVYVFGGGPRRSGDTGTDLIHEHDPATGVFRPLATRLPSTLHDVPAVVAPASTADCPAGCVYLFGGARNDGNLRKEILRFEPVSGRVDVVGNLTATTAGAAAAWDPRDLPGAGCPGGCAYVFGGKMTRTEVTRFNPATGSVAVVAHFPRNVRHAAAAWTGTDFVIAGGEHGPGDTEDSTLWRYAPGDAAPQELPDRFPRTLLPGVFVHQAGAYVLGGASMVPSGRNTGNPSTATCEVRRLDLATNALALVPGSLCGEGGVAWTGTEALAYASCAPGKEGCVSRVLVARYSPP